METFPTSLLERARRYKFGAEAECTRILYTPTDRRQGSDCQEPSSRVAERNYTWSLMRPISLATHLTRVANRFVSSAIRCEAIL